MSAQDTIRLLQALNSPVQAAAPQLGVLEPGQKPSDLLTNPSVAQNRGLLAASLEMMGHDPTRMPGETIQKAFQSGFGAMDAARAVPYQVAQDQRDTAIDMARLGMSGQDPAAVREWEYLQQLDPEQRKQFMAMKRSGQVVSLPGGGIALRNPDGSMQTIYDPAEGTALNAAEEGAKETARGSASTATAQVNDGIAQAWGALDAHDIAIAAGETAEKYLGMLDAGEIDTGPINSALYNIFGVGTEELAQLDADGIENLLQNLQVTNLAPVTIAELKMVAKLWADVAKQERPNRGLLKKAITRSQRAAEMAKRDAATAAGMVKEYGGADEYSRLLSTNPFVKSVVGERETPRSTPASGQGPQWLESARQGVQPQHIGRFTVETE